jgi:ABC-type transporter Mla subunit MlaD
MIKKTIAVIEEKVRQLDSMEKDNRTQLLTLLATLKTEIEELAKTRREEAESILGFTTVTTHETLLRQDKNPHLVKVSLEGLASSVKGFETSHPTLVGTVNRICVMLSNIGI